mmetsp:Transcript_3780/g.6599  ORF Transcript_3780/g.6599 Transcript_3780/m.6599 type:complete len:424 (-) Transcript_3780:72-1343(-)
MVLALGGLGVEPSTNEGNNSTGEGLGGEDLLEENNGGEDNSNTLNNVADTMANRADTLKSVERELVVEMVKKTNGNKLSVKALSTNLSNGGVDTGRKSSTLNKDGHRNADKDRDKGGIGIDGGTAEGLAHDLLGPHSTEAEGKVGDHGGDKASPVEGELTGRSHGNTEHDGEKGESDGDGGRGTKNELGEDNIEGRLEGLDGVSQRNSDCGEGDVGGNVAESVHGSGAKKTGKLLASDRPLERSIFQPNKVHNNAVNETNNDVNGGDSVGEREVLEDGLVKKIEGNVQSIPEENVAKGDGGRSKFGSDNFSKAGLQGIDFGSSLGLNRRTDNNLLPGMSNDTAGGADGKRTEKGSHSLGTLNDGGNLDGNGPLIGGNSGNGTTPLHQARHCTVLRSTEKIRKIDNVFELNTRPKNRSTEVKSK